MGRPSKVRSTHEKMGNQNEQKYLIPLLYRRCDFWVVVFFYLCNTLMVKL